MVIVNLLFSKRVAVYRWMQFVQPEQNADLLLEQQELVQQYCRTALLVIQVVALHAQAVQFA